MGVSSLETCAGNQDLLVPMDLTTALLDCVVQPSPAELLSWQVPTRAAYHTNSSMW